MNAIRYTGANRLDVARFLCGDEPIPNVLLRDQPTLRLDGRTVARPGDWVVRAPGGGKWRVRAAALILAALALLPATAGAVTCGERTVMLKGFLEKYSESPQAMGIAKDGGVIEILVSPEGGWTMIVSYPRRPTCVIAVGTHWGTFPAGLQGSPS